MERNKASVIVIFLLGGFFVLGLAMVLNTTARRNAILNRQGEVDKKIEYLNSIDLTIYWIGEVPEELEKLKDSMVIIKPEEISKENMPIKFTSFHITITDPDDESGRPTLPPTEIMPRDYSEYMLIVINTSDGFNEISDGILHNCIVENGVPVLTVGGPASDHVGTILIHGAGYASDYSMFYKLREGYNEPFLDKKAVSSGGLEFAEELTTKLSDYFKGAAQKKYIEASELWSSAISSADDAATATTTDPKNTENSSSETRAKILVKP
ncbi:MAG: hypothetical protein J6W36_02830 [Clostridiales bacterium]|nr:hypothetical protein [Clostridiales bacterium]